MRFSQDASSNVNVIRGYGPEGLKINEEIHRGSVMLTAAAIRLEPELHSVTELGAHHVTQLLALEPELILVGTGPHQVFPDPAFGAAFLQAGIGFEVMDTGAACRTFNVLVSEQRRVVALLLAHRAADK
jgi:uncharacterized protein